MGLPRIDTSVVEAPIAGVAPNEIGDYKMANKLLHFGALLLALSLPVAAHAQSDLRLCPPQTHSETFPNGNGYWCVPNSW